LSSHFALAPGALLSPSKLVTLLEAHKVTIVPQSCPPYSLDWMGIVQSEDS
jgi:hypothetical protein